jgi:hypothetical protein
MRNFANKPLTLALSRKGRGNKIFLSARGE